MNPAGSSSTIRHSAFFLAALSVALCVLGTGRAVVVFRHNAANSADMALIFKWMGLPQGLAIAGIVATLRERVGPLWFCVGALFGFVILAAWSLGLFYGFAAWALLAAALVHLVSIRPRWRIVLAPPTVFLVRDWAQARPYQHTVAPAEVWGGWLFAVVGAALAATYLVAALVQRRLHET
jgi:hypothetical protein